MGDKEASYSFIIHPLGKARNECAPPHCYGAVPLRYYGFELSIKKRSIICGGELRKGLVVASAVGLS